MALTTSSELPEKHSRNEGENEWRKNHNHGHQLDEDVRGEVSPIEEAKQKSGHHRSQKEDGGADQNDSEDVEAEPFADPALWCDPMLQASGAIHDGRDRTFPSWESEEILAHGRADHRARLHK